MARPRKAAPLDTTRAIAYLRVSTDDQRNGIDAQRSALEAWARANGVAIVATCIDEGISGAAPLAERPGLQAAVAALRELGAGTLAVAKRDRLARDVLTALTVEHMVRGLGARVATVDGPQGDTPTDELMRRVMDAFAAHERTLIASRTRAALAAKKARGERVGQVPYGYSVGPCGRVLEPNAAEQQAIARARELRSTGATLQATSDTLAHEGFLSRAGTPFACTAVARMTV